VSSQLSGKQYDEFREALADAFTEEELEMMLQFRFNRRLDRITRPGNFEYVVHQLILAAQRQGWHLDLLRAARESRPVHPGLIGLAAQFGAAPEGIPAKAELEKVIQGTNSFLDVAKWREKMGAIEGRVCRVEIGGRPQGTAFLLGPSVVLTNYHVVEQVIRGEAGPGDVVLRFDFKRLGGGSQIYAGQEMSLATGDGWLLDSSRYSDVDLALDPKPGDPGPEELDYALLQVQGEPGENAIGSNPEPGAPRRGWIDLPQTEDAFQPDSPLFILQHPLGAALKLAMDTRAVIGLYGAGRRVRYRTNTEPGSSGSPVFDQNWNLVALHHAGDPSSIMPSYNEGIPITRIAELIRRRGVGGYLGTAPSEGTALLRPLDARDANPGVVAPARSMPRIDPDNPPFAALRGLLNAAFDAPGLLHFCQEHEHFQRVVAQFGPGHGLEDMVDRVLDYTKTQLRWDELLAGVAEENPYQFERFVQQLRGLPGRVS